MGAAHSSQFFGVWTSSQCPFAIEYLPQVTEEIRMAVETAFYALPHGGLEIGGILLGSYTSERVVISAFRPLQCEHAFGPTFRLTASDHSRLSIAVEEAQAAGQTVVGWYHSHTRSEVFLSKDDLELHYYHFKEPWQVALVLKPVALKPMSCGFFFRETDGTIHGAGSYREFQLEGAPSERRHAESTGQDDGQGLKLTAVVQTHGRQRESGELPQAPQEPAAASLPAEELTPGEADFSSPPADELPQWEIDRRASLRREPRGGRFPWSRALAGVAGVLTVVLVLALAYESYVRLRPIAPATVQQAPVEKTLGLRIHRLGTDLVLTWEGNAIDTLGATAGLISIKDGPTQKAIGLNLEQLRSAIFLLTPQSDHVEIELTMLLPNERTASELGIVNLPALTSDNEAVPGKPVPARKSAPVASQPETQGKAKPPEVKFSKPFVAPLDHNHTLNATSLDQPPTLTPTEPAERSQPAPLASLRTFKSFPPPPSAAPAATAPAGHSPAKSSPDEMRVGGNVQLPTLVLRKDPVYPYSAHVAGIQDVVVLEGLVGPDGRMSDIQVIRGLQLFRQAAIDAVKQWVYKPAMLNGAAVEARVRVEIRFREGM